MGGRRLRTDTLGMSEAIGVAVLIGLTITVTAMVGVNVLVLSGEDDGGVPQANFTYDHVEGSGLLIVTHAGGDELEAGNIEFRGRGNNATWAELANRNETATVGPGDITQLGSGNAYGQSVQRDDRIAIYLNRSGNRTKLSEWNGG
ncbi:type IV pilin N-terminal domain-containing protein [Halomicroarcula sp. GCM10025817]|uniref:type IV pilin N-terminal domain-containing protein n=1 Tax=Haloarcula TaxID=2237 RepID=UPI0023E86E9E|nr:type IV pilin N-terminal domain-containing protein [Halomicroarcula sp. SYNS111]